LASSGSLSKPRAPSPAKRRSTPRWHAPGGALRVRLLGSSGRAFEP
jgi:hypothetical protein